MTDLLLAGILLMILIQWHHQEKRTGWYGKLSVLIKKRVIRKICKSIFKVFHSIKSR